MSSTITIPAKIDIGAFSTEVSNAMAARGNYDAAVANDLIDGLTAAKTDIEALQAGSTITGVNGTTIAAGGALTTGQVLRATAADAAGWGAVNLAAAAAVTGVLPAANVGGVNGATVPAAGALTTGNVLQVSGASALSYGAVNLAGGSNYVTGALPGANMAAAVAGVSAGAVTAADQTWINSTPSIQEATVTLASGTATINTVITLAANSRILCNPVGDITGSTDYAHCREKFASRVNGGAGVASAVIEALAANGTKDADAAGDVHLVILTPHA